MRVVSSLDELLQLPRDKRVNGFRVREPLVLEIPALTRHALRDAQEALNGLQERRGSFASSAVMFVALLYGVVQVFHRNASILSVRAWLELAVVLGISFCLGALGKAAALAFTRWQFAFRCRAQHRMLSMLLHDPTMQ
jgi:hypothetical protein